MSTLEPPPEEPPGSTPDEGASRARCVSTPATQPGRSRRAPEVPIGQTFGRYQVIDEIGRGGMSVVYRAHDPELDRRVALKLVRVPGAGGSIRIGERTLREAHALARLAHPNVVSIYDVGVTEDTVFLAMELVAGQTLRKWSGAHPRTVDEVLDVMIAAGRGLVAAHAAGIVHRDFKPDNVLIGDDGRVRVVDFGLARALAVDEPAAVVSTLPESTPREAAGDRRVTGDAQSSPSHRFEATLTLAGTIIGTPGYLAPEQYRRAPVNAATDQFQFSVTLFEALCRRRPFAPSEGDHPAWVTLQGVFTFPPEVRIPRRVRRAITRGLAPDPGDRFPDLAAMLRELMPRRRSRAAMLLGAMTVLSLGAATMAWTFGRAEPPNVCALASAPIRHEWTPARRGAIEAAFRTSAAATGLDAFARLALRVDAWTAAWATEADEACRATHVRHTQSPMLLDRRVRCLDAERAELHALLGQLAPPLDRRTIDAALAAVEALPDPAGCGQDGAPSPLAMTAPESAPLLDELRDVAAMRATARFAAAQHVLDRLGAQVRGEPLLAAATAIEQARLFDAAAASLRSEPVWRQALADAALGGSDALVADALVGLIGALAAQARFGDVDALADVVRALLAKEGPRPLLLADLERAVGRVAYERGDLVVAIQHFERAVGAVESSAGADSPRLARYVLDVGNVHLTAGDLVAARTHYERALTLLQNAYGDDHSEVASAAGSLALVRSREGDRSGALAELARAQATHTRILGPASLLVAIDLMNQAAITDDTDAGRVLFAQAVAIATDEVGADHPITINAMAGLADRLLRAGDLAAAEPMLVKALDAMSRRVGPRHASLGYPLMSLAALYVQTDRASQARPRLEEAMGVFGDGHSDPSALAYAHWLMAQATWADGGDRDYARAMARMAETTMRGLGDPGAEDLAEVQRWLANHRR